MDNHSIGGPTSIADERVFAMALSLRFQFSNYGPDAPSLYAYTELVSRRQVPYAYIGLNPPAVRSSYIDGFVDDKHSHSDPARFH